VKMSDRKVEMTTHLELSETETRMLGWLAGFGGKAIAEHICGNLGREFKAEEWEQFWSAMRTECEAADKVFKDTRSVFRGWSKAQRC
jgi:hypothetical protein